MININQLYNFIIKMIAAGLTLFAFTTSTGSLALPLAHASDSKYYLNLHSKHITIQKNNHKNNTHFKQESLFGKLRKNFNRTNHFTAMQHSPEVQKHFKKFNLSKKAFIKTTTLASSHLHYILEQVEKRRLPGELALLPMLESNFQPHAISNRGAVGLWQFMPGTGRQFGLKQHAGYDGRKDVKASTNAALNYLEYLHKKFNCDWMLALAAYNAGEGTVERAIKHNKKAGKPTSFWFLKLPKQTREYVPKFLALTQMIH